MRRQIATALAMLVLLSPASAQFRPSPERQARTEADYRATLARLGINIAQMRPGAEGFNRQSPNADNLDESKAAPKSPLPPLITVAHPTVRWWRSVRRPQLVRLLEDEMYGRVPATAPKIEWTLISREHVTKSGIPAIARHYRGTAAGSKLAIDFSLTVPERPTGHVPVVLELGFPEGFRFPGFPPPPERPEGPWTAQVLKRGWAYAILDPRSVQPDDGAGLSEGVIGIAARGRPRRCTIGARCGPGPGARAARSTCCRANRRSTNIESRS